MVSTAALQGAFSGRGVKLLATIGATPFRRRRTNKENTMLRNFTAALIATALLAGPALAAQPSNDAGASPAASSAAPANTKAQAAPKSTEKRKPAKTVKRVRSHGRHHVAHVLKPGKAAKTPKS